MGAYHENEVGHVSEFDDAFELIDGLVVSDYVLKRDGAVLLHEGHFEGLGCLQHVSAQKSINC